MTDHYNLWVDGSYRSKHGTAGGGFILEGQDSQFSQSQTFTDIGKEHPNGSSIAELLALNFALAEIPKDSTLTIHTDCQEMVQWLERKSLSQKQQRANNTQLINSFSQALNSIEEMQNIEFKLTSDKNNANMQRAHQLSAEASTVGEKKVRHTTRKNPTRKR